MPTVNINRDILFARLGRTYTDEEFDELCFEFGIELDEVTSEKKMLAKERGAETDGPIASEDIIYKIEIPANRYDLLCMEGLVLALRVFLGKSIAPTYLISTPASPSGRLQVFVKPETASVRPVVVAAVLRNVTITPEAYASFIDFQDKLHNAIGRKRTLMSMGTHDLDTIEGPFTYEALPPEQISFVPLSQQREMNGVELMEHYESDLKLKKFLPLIKSSPVYPVFYDAKRRVMSLPPIINSEHSKIRLETKNIFVDITGTDYTKCTMALSVLTTAFSQYCHAPFTVEQVDIHYPNGNVDTTPDLAERLESVPIDYINRSIGVTLSGEDVVTLLNRMMLKARVATDGVHIVVHVPPSRTDILHPCDIMEDAAIAYGFNNINKTLPKTPTVGAENPLNKLTDQLRREIALCGFSEILSLTLCSTAENYEFLRRENPGNEAVVLSNPKTLEYEVVRTTLYPGLLKTIACSKSAPLPIKIFEFGDVVFLDSHADVGARNQRQLAVLYAGATSGLEIIQGIFDRLLQMLEIRRGTDDLQVAASSNPTYFPDRSADIVYKGKVIGSYGILHPEVLEKFEVPFVTSALEINIEPFL